MSWKPYLLTGAVLAALLVHLEMAMERGAAPEKQASSTYKVMILGFDGADPEFLEYLVSLGKLPNFARLMKEGAYAPCLTFKPTKSVVVWTSIATGKRMEKHGIIDWMLLSPDGREKVMATGNVRKVEALWNIASANGHDVEVLNWWATWPVEPVKGEMISNHWPKSLRKPLEEVTYPGSLAAELEPLAAIHREDAEREMRASGIPVYSPELAESTFLPSDNFRIRFQTSAGVFHEDLLVERAADFLLRTRGQRDLFAVLFRTADVFTHFLWRFIDRRVARKVYERLRVEKAPLTPGIEKTMNQAYARVLESVYTHEDRRLGHFLDQAGPDTVVIVVSDHGFQFRNYGFNHYDHGEGGVKAPPGVIFLHGPPIRHGVRLDHPTVFDVAPTALYLMGIPVGEDMDGRVLTEAIVSEQFGRRAVAWIPTHETGGRGGQPRRSPFDQEIMKELRSLGYIP